MKLVFLDTETTGLTEYDRLCQLAFKVEDEIHNELYKPPVDINIEAMRVHHITNEDVADKPAFKDSEEYPRIKKMLESSTHIMICHNVPYDEKMLKREGIEPKKTICTLKLARHLLKDNPKIKKFNLQYLRTELDIDVEGAVAHDAFGDIVILEQLFNALYTIAETKANEWALKRGEKEFTRKQIIERMLEICNKPDVVIDTMPFGKYQGQKLKDCVPTDKRYFSWLLKEKGSTDDPLFANIKQILNG